MTVFNEQDRRRHNGQTANLLAKLGGVKSKKVFTPQPFFRIDDARQS
jgi:hypothetical protein